MTTEYAVASSDPEFVDCIPGMIVLHAMICARCIGTRKDVRAGSGKIFSFGPGIRGSDPGSIGTKVAHLGRKRYIRKNPDPRADPRIRPRVSRILGMDVLRVYQRVANVYA